MGDFTKLQVWILAKELAVEMYSLTASEKFSKDYDMRNQLRRAAVSVPSNIAEGEESGSNPQSIRFFNIAKGSLAELRTQCIIVLEIGYLTIEDYTCIHDKAIKISSMLYKLILSRKTTKP